MRVGGSEFEESDLAGSAALGALLHDAQVGARWSEGEPRDHCHHQAANRNQNRGRQGVPHQRDSLEIEPEQKQDQERGRGGARTPDEEPIGDDRVG